MRLVGITISTKPENWAVKNVPLYCHVGPIRNYPRTDQMKDISRVNFLAEQRNEAMRLYSDGATHVLNIESYYLKQTKAIEKLVGHYLTFTKTLGDGFMLGGLVWYRRKTRLFGNRPRVYDTWAVPELSEAKYPLNKGSEAFGLIKVSSVGSCFIFPLEAWLKNGFQNAGFPQRFYYNNLCDGFNAYIDPTVAFWRTSVDSDVPRDYPLTKRMRCTFGEWRRKIV